QHFVMADNYSPNDEDKRNIKLGYQILRRMGRNTASLVNNITSYNDSTQTPIHRQLLADVGITKEAILSFQIPGDGFDFVSGTSLGSGSETPTDQGISDWAGRLAKESADAGFRPDQMSLIIMSDERAWGIPSLLSAVNNGVYTTTP